MDSCLQLEVYYRYLPTFQKAANEHVDNVAGEIGMDDNDDDGDLNIEIDL